MKKDVIVCDRCGARAETPWILTLKPLGERGKPAVTLDVCDGCASEVRTK